MNTYRVNYLSGTTDDVEAEYPQSEGDGWLQFKSADHKLVLMVKAAEVLSVALIPAAAEVVKRGVRAGVR